jgi:hypothetical protein
LPEELVYQRLLKRWRVMLDQPTAAGQEVEQFLVGPDMNFVDTELGWVINRQNAQ